MRKILVLSSVVATLSIFNSSAAFAQYCEGTVHGLSGRYNPATGSGFLAVRAGPKRSATQVGELFNGDTVEVFSRRGSWYRVASTTDARNEGWVSARYLRNDCRY
jgi:Bacterial SH3 domain